MLEAGVIKESDGPLSCGAIRIKYGSLRYCIDYNISNSRTRKDVNTCILRDVHILPRFDVVDTLSDCKFISKLALRSGYWQITITE